MSRGMLCDVLDRDRACAVALGFIDMPGVAANVHTLTIHDANMQPLGSVSDWLDDSDPLDAATRVYLQARLEAANSAPKAGARPWEAAARTKARDEANKRGLEARARARAILEERGVLPR
jgi:hypothetical protein